MCEPQAGRKAWDASPDQSCGRGQLRAKLGNLGGHTDKILPLLDEVTAEQGHGRPAQGPTAAPPLGRHNIHHYVKGHVKKGKKRDSKWP